jgi:hypothetical protein
MKNYLFTIFSLLIFSSCFGIAGAGINSPVTGFIDIQVESNINKVSFSYPLSESNISSSGERMTGKADIVVPVKDFKCTNRIAYRDFLKLLRANEYPEIKVSIPGNIVEQLQNKESVVLHDVLITIAGTSKKYDIICKSERKKGSGDNILVGTISVRLEDLNIDPPEKYFGMVKIKDHVIVKFGLGIKG